MVQLWRRSWRAFFLEKEKPRFFPQTLNPKRKRYRKNSTVISKHTHTQKRALLNAFHTTLARREIRAFLARKGRKNTFCLCFFFGVLLILDTNFASLARAFSALFGIERIYGPCPHSTLTEVTVHFVIPLKGEEE